MRTAVEISLYPLDADYVPPIKDFIERLNGHEGLTIVTNAMSTQVAGEHGRLFAALEQETRREGALAFQFLEEDRFDAGELGDRWHGGIIGHA